MNSSILRITRRVFHCVPKRVTTPFAARCHLSRHPLCPLHGKCPQVSDESAIGEEEAERNALKQASVRIYLPVRGGEATVRVLWYTSSLLRSARLGFSFSVQTTCSD